MSNTSKRSGAELTTDQLSSKPWYAGTHFYVFFLALVGSLFGLKEADAQTIVLSAVSVGSLAFGVRSYIRQGQVDFWTWVKSPNTWAFAGNILALLFVKSPEQGQQLGETTGQIINAAATGNYTLLIQALLSAGTIIWHIFQGRK